MGSFESRFNHDFSRLCESVLVVQCSLTSRGVDERRDSVKWGRRGSRKNLKPRLTTTREKLQRWWLSGANLTDLLPGCVSSYAPRCCMGCICFAVWCTVANNGGTDQVGGLFEGRYPLFSSFFPDRRPAFFFHDHPLCFFPRDPSPRSFLSLSLSVCFPSLFRSWSILRTGRFR